MSNPNSTESNRAHFMRCYGAFRVGTRRVSNGVGMVEVLVAMIILAIGMLGTATLYATALQAKTTAQSRMHAVNLATDLADRIRANRTAGSGYLLALSGTVTAPTSATNCIQSATAAITCTPAQMAAADLHEWIQLVTTTLPGSVSYQVGVAAIAGTDQSTYTITVNWTEASTGSNTLSHVLVVRI